MPTHFGVLRALLDQFAKTKGAFGDKWGLLLLEIVLDTETTGFDPTLGHKIVEIGCVELKDHMPTGKTYHQYVNPARDIPSDALAVHGLSREFLSEHPIFGDVAEQFLEFIGDATLVIHNAAFDMAFINAELNACDIQSLPMERAIDTIAIAREKFPGARVNLDNLCQRFGIDNSKRDLHGALMDAQLLAGVYLELIGGRQHDLGLKNEKANDFQDGLLNSSPRPFREPRSHACSAEEILAHSKFISRIKNNLWPD